MASRSLDGCPQPETGEEWSWVLAWAGSKDLRGSVGDPRGGERDRGSREGCP